MRRAEDSRDGRGASTGEKNEATTIVTLSVSRSLVPFALRQFTLLGKVNLNPIFVRTATPVVSAKYRTNTSITSNLVTGS